MDLNDLNAIAPPEPPTEAPAFVHISVLSRELIAGLAISPGGHYLDATVGGGGHSRSILEAAPDVRITAIDRDEQAIALRSQPSNNRPKLIKAINR